VVSATSVALAVGKHYVHLRADSCCPSYDGHVFVCLPAGYAEWPQDACSISPAKEVADAVKSAQKKNGSDKKIKVTVCEALAGEAGDILFFPPKGSDVKGPCVFRGAAQSPAGIEWFLKCALEGSGPAAGGDGMKCDSLDGIAQVFGRLQH
jgi:hypothetical protein